MQKIILSFTLFLLSITIYAQLYNAKNVTKDLESYNQGTVKVELIEYTTTADPNSTKRYRLGKIAENGLPAIEIGVQYLNQVPQQFFI